MQWHPEFHDLAHPVTLDDTPILHDFLTCRPRGLALIRAPAAHAPARIFLGCLRFALALLLLASSAAHPASLRIATAFDPQTMDPHALALLYHSRVAFQVYESLVGRNEKFQLEPALAVSWQMTAPTRWRFRLRPDVSFHDGTPLTADDVVFSLERAMIAPSQRAFQLKGVAAVRKLDPLQVEFQLEAPTPCCPRSCSSWPS